MKIAPFASLLALGLASSANAGSTDAPFLRGSQCLDPNLARSWVELDDRTILVDAGRNKYRIEVSGACTSLSFSQVLVFRGDPVSGRVCGSLGDAILTRDYPCKIDRMQLISKAEYKQAMDDRAAERKRRKAERKSKGS